MAVDHDLLRGALGERDDRRAAGERLDHDHPERLVPADRHQQRRGARVQLLLGGAGDLADVAARAGRRCAARSARGSSRPGRVWTGPASTSRRPARRAASIARCGALDRIHAADPQQVVVLVDAQRPASRRRSGWARPPRRARRRGRCSTLRAADRHEVGPCGRGVRRSAAVSPTNGPCSVCTTGAPTRAAIASGREARVVVDDVERSSRGRPPRRSRRRRPRRGRTRTAPSRSRRGERRRAASCTRAEDRDPGAANSVTSCPRATSASQSRSTTASMPP